MIDITLYQVNVIAGLVLTASFFALVLLMVLLRPRTLLEKLALVFAFSCCAVMMRWSAAIVAPDYFSVRDSFVPTVIFVGASISTLIFAAVAWIEHVRDARK